MLINKLIRFRELGWEKTLIHCFFFKLSTTCSYRSTLEIITNEIYTVFIANFGFDKTFWKCSYWWRMFVELGGWRILLQPSFVLQQWEYFWTIFLNPTESHELLNNCLIVMKYWNVIFNWLLSLNAMQMNEVVMMRKWNSNLTMDVLYDDDGEHRIRVLFNDPIHKEEITGNKNIITQIEETKVIIDFLVFH